MQGTLKVKGTFSTWSKYYFVLQNNMLLKFKTKESVPLEQIDMTQHVSVMNAEGLSGKSKTIALFISSRSPIILRAETQGEQKLWLDALVNATKQAKGANVESDETIIQTLEGVLDAVIVTDEKANILGFNKPAECMYGYTKQEMIGKNVKLLMPEMLGRIHDNYVQQYNNTGHKKLIGVQREMVAKKKDGSTFHIMLSLGEVPQYKLGTTKCRFVAMMRNVQEVHSSDESTTDDLASDASPYTGHITVLKQNKKEQQAELESILKNTESKMVEHFEKMIQDTKQSVHAQLVDLNKKHMVNKFRLDLLEKENARLMDVYQKQGLELLHLHKELASLKGLDTVIPQDKDKALSFSPEDVVRVLKNPVSFEIVKNYAASEFSIENVLFWSAVQQFRSIIGTSTRHDHLKYIYDMYIRAGADHEININQVLKDKVKQALQDNETQGTPLNDDLLTPLEKAVEMNLTDTYMRMLQSQSHRAHLNESFKVKKKALML